MKIRVTHQAFQNITLMLLFTSYVALYVGASQLGRYCGATDNSIPLCKIAP